VTVGPQHWQALPDGDGLLILWSGTLGYALADRAGRQEPWGIDGHAGYRLTRDGDRWLLGTWTADTHAPLRVGWPHKVPVPNGYLPGPAAPSGDPNALTAVRGAAAAWQAATASTLAFDATGRGKTGNDGQGNDAHRIDGTVAAAPARGDATTVFGYDGKPKTSHSIVLDHGSQALSQVRGTPHAKPGATLPARVLWASRRRPEPSDGTGYNPDPFATAALLGQAAAASPGACPTGLTAAACYTAVVVSTDAGDPLAYEYTGVSRREGRAYLVLDVGVDPRGRLGFVRVAQTSRVLGRTDTVLTGTSRYTAYPDTPPPPPSLPNPSTVASSDDLEYR